MSHASHRISRYRSMFPRLTNIGGYRLQPLLNPVFSTVLQCISYILRLSVLCGSDFHFEIIPSSFGILYGMTSVILGLQND